MGTTPLRIIQDWPVFCALHSALGYNQTVPTDLALLQRMAESVEARRPMLDPEHAAALRLFNGFYEGWPGLVVDLYGRSLVVFNHADPPDDLQPSIPAVLAGLREQLPWLKAVLVKTRNSPNPADRRGVLAYGGPLDRRICERGVWYAIDLTMNQDASFYLDTRALRFWLQANLAGKSVLNTFAYTGSLGAAARAGGAGPVLQTDRSARFLDLACETWVLNGWPLNPRDFQSGDFYRVIAALKSQRRLFDCLILDPPFFSTSPSGRVDLLAEGQHLINKVRPLVADGGWLVAVNNALFLSGADYLNALQALCADGFMTLAEFIPVPEDVTGLAVDHAASLPADPAPFNHPTKIAILRVRRKDQAPAR